MTILLEQLFTFVHDRRYRGALTVQDGDLRLVHAFSERAKPPKQGRLGGGLRRARRGRARANRMHERAK